MLTRVPMNDEGSPPESVDASLTFKAQQEGGWQTIMEVPAHYYLQTDREAVKTALEILQSTAVSDTVATPPR